MSDRQTDVSIPAANLAMVRAGISALALLRLTGADRKENGDANIAYAVYEAMRAEATRQLREDDWSNGWPDSVTQLRRPLILPDGNSSSHG